MSTTRQIETVEAQAPAEGRTIEAITGEILELRRGQRMETVYKCKFHDNCGQRVDWENQQSYCRPPEGEA